MSTGTQIRDFVDVSTVADQFLDAIDFRGVEAGRPQIKNIGSGIPKTLLQFAQEWWLSWGATGRLIPGQFEMRPGELGRLVANVHDVHIV
jgi:nucleoside-diphosphate-sugar epimerase